MLGFGNDYQEVLWTGSATGRRRPGGDPLSGKGPLRRTFVILGPSEALRSFTGVDLPTIPREGGSLALGGHTALCMKCGWRGVPTSVPDAIPPKCWAQDEHGRWFKAPRRSEGAVSTFCPPCETAPMVDEEYALLTIPKVARNAPCPCGSGKKFKKCHG